MRRVRLNDLAARLPRRDLMFATVGSRSADLMSPLDHRKSERELSGTPRPVEEAVAAAARLVREQRD